jgi:hypothetical protein
MADSKISALTAATTPLVGTEVLPIVQSGSTVKVSVNNLTAGKAVSVGSLAATTTGSFLGQLSFAPGSTNGMLCIANTGASARLQIQLQANNASSVLKTMYIGQNIFNSNSSLELASGDTGTGIKIAPTGIVTMDQYGAGAATFSAAGVISSVSDETWKIKDGVPADPDSMIKKLEPGYWYYNDEKKETFGTERQLGFYAQNVNAAIGPEAAPEPSSHTKVDLDGNETTTTRPWGYYDRSVLAVTVMSLQKALATIESLTARIEALEAKIPA